MAQNRAEAGFTCSGCDASWTGLGRAHCAACHRTYSTAGLFTAHRRDVRGVGTCMEPAPDMRLIDGLWRGPEVGRDWIPANGLGWIAS